MLAPYQSYLLLIAMLSLTDSHPTRRHTNKNKEDNFKHSTSLKEENSSSTDNLFTNQVFANEIISSPFVRFSSTKPLSPPWLTEEAVSLNTTNNNRSRRSTEHLGISVCDTLREWSQPDTAIDFNGKTVEVMTMINQDGARQLQYFYETFCSSDDEPPCLGIDTSAYSSKCITKYIWVNAYVRNERNQVGWARIKIRGSCNCSLWSLSAGPPSIWDELLKRR